MNWIVICFELIGTVAFALSGGLTGLRKRMDIFGVCVLGLTTATGGASFGTSCWAALRPKPFSPPVTPSSRCRSPS